MLQIVDSCVVHREHGEWQRGALREQSRQGTSLTQPDSSVKEYRASVRFGSIFFFTIIIPTSPRRCKSRQHFREEKRRKRQNQYPAFIGYVFRRFSCFCFFFLSHPSVSLERERGPYRTIMQLPCWRCMPQRCCSVFNHYFFIQLFRQASRWKWKRSHSGF